MTVTPLRNKLALEALPAPAYAGVLTLVRAEHPTRRYRVCAVGPEVRDLAVGQVVLVSALAGIEVGGWTLVSEDAVLAVVDA